MYQLVELLQFRSIAENNLCQVRPVRNAVLIAFRTEGFPDGLLQGFVFLHEAPCSLISFIHRHTEKTKDVTNGRFSASQPSGDAYAQQGVAELFRLLLSGFVAVSRAGHLETHSGLFDFHALAVFQLDTESGVVDGGNFTVYPAGGDNLVAFVDGFEEAALFFSASAFAAES
jgi:hypothetical protein